MLPQQTNATLDVTVELSSPVGRLLISANAEGVTAIDWPTGSAKAVTCSAHEHPIAAKCAAQLQEYFAGQRQRFDLPLSLAGSPFQNRVWAALQSIEFGATTSYGDIARALIPVSSPRAVGGAVGRNPIPIIVPCHRVIGSAGDLTGFAGGLDIKRWLLAHEGHRR